MLLGTPGASAAAGPRRAAIYFRLRDEGYTPADLEKWVDRLVEIGAGWTDAFVYFKHEDAGKGPEFARTFVESLERRGVSAR